jgi:hypothetical protein
MGDARGSVRDSRGGIRHWRRPITPDWRPAATAGLSAGKFRAMRDIWLGGSIGTITLMTCTRPSKTARVRDTVKVAVVHGDLGDPRYRQHRTD